MRKHPPSKPASSGHRIEEIQVTREPISMVRVCGFGCGTTGSTPDGPSTNMYIQFDLPGGAKTPMYAFALTNVPALCQMIMAAVERSEERGK